MLHENVMETKSCDEKCTLRAWEPLRRRSHGALIVHAVGPFEHHCWTGEQSSPADVYAAQLLLPNACFSSGVNAPFPILK